MSRTTISLDPPLLKKLKTISHEEDVTLRKLVEELLLLGLQERHHAHRSPAPWTLPSKKLHAKVDLEDKERIHQILETR